MASDEHLSLLLQGSIVWNEWRRSNPDIRPDFSGADLSRMDLHESDLEVRPYEVRLAELRPVEVRVVEPRRDEPERGDIPANNFREC